MLAGDGDAAGGASPVRTSGVEENRAAAGRDRRDRKSTRLNSSHANNSYAVFCLKKKNVPPDGGLGAHDRLDLAQEPGLVVAGGLHLLHRKSMPESLGDHAPPGGRRRLPARQRTL